MKRLNILMPLALAGLLLVSSCASKKNIVRDAVPSSDSKPSVAVAEQKAQVESARELQLRQLQFAQRVFDTKVYVKNIVGDMKFNIKAGLKNITVPGALRMRKDEVIRLQIYMPLLGTEIGRVEFTPTYVLVIDRLHKEYVKADYNQLDFLKSNGLNFYTLQALFWNQLFIPGQKEVTERDLGQYEVKFASDVTTLSTRKGSLSVEWLANSKAAQIMAATVKYISQKHGESTLGWSYDDFKAVGLKSFPATHKILFQTTSTKKKQNVTVTINMSEVTTKDNWEATTKISDRYKQIQAQDALKKIMNLGI